MVAGISFLGRKVSCYSQNMVLTPSMCFWTSRGGLPFRAGVKPRPSADNTAKIY